MEKDKLFCVVIPSEGAAYPAPDEHTAYIWALTWNTLNYPQIKTESFIDSEVCNCYAKVIEWVGSSFEHNAQLRIYYQENRSNNDSPLFDFYDLVRNYIPVAMKKDVFLELFPVEGVN